MANYQHQGTVQVANRSLSRLRFNQHRYDAAKCSLVAPNGTEIRLRAKTQQVFELLAAKPNEVVARHDLFNSVWGDVIVTDDSLNQSIREIRKALGDTDRNVLETMPRQGYMLHAVENAESGNNNVKSKTGDRRFPMLFVSVVLSVLLFLLSIYKLNENSPMGSTPIPPTQQVASRVEDTSHSLKPIERNFLTVSVELVTHDGGRSEDQLDRAVVTALSRYGNINPVLSKSAASDYQLELGYLDGDTASINLQLLHQRSAELVMADTLVMGEKNIKILAEQIAALIGSPAGGAIGHHLLYTSRSKPIAELTRSECLAHGYGCTSCSGELDSITSRAVQCLASLIDKDPNDPDAWALQSTVYSRQYFWGSAMNEPFRSNQSKRHHFKNLAVEAATRAEGLSDGSNPSVYWGMAQAYLAKCDANKLFESVSRGLAISPNDPVLLGGLGSFTAYAGKWSEGIELVNRAIDADPKSAEKWWYFALAKNHYRVAEYDEAYKYFLKGFDERNWLSHLQLAYTLPHLDRLPEARDALQSLMRVAPGVTLEHVIEFYESYCFDADFIQKLQSALTLIDMPSRPARSEVKINGPIGAQVIKLNNRDFEYIDVGEGDPVIFIHGSFSDYRNWAYMMIPVSKRHRFISYTLRHFGTLPWPAETVSFDLYEDEKELIQFIEKLGLKSVVLVGWSRGVQPAVMVARSRPDLISKLVLYEGTVTELDPPDSSDVSRSAEHAKQVTEMQTAVEEGDYLKAVKPLFEIALQYPPNTFEIQPTALQRVILDNSRTLIQLFDDPLIEQPNFNCDYYSAIEIPALVVHGEHTDPFWQFESETMAECIPNAKLHVLSGATHDGPLSQPQALTEIISGYIAE